LDKIYLLVGDSSSFIVSVRKLGPLVFNMRAILPHCGVKTIVIGIVLDFLLLLIKFFSKGLMKVILAHSPGGLLN
jgi:hypothetical protein